MALITLQTLTIRGGLQVGTRSVGMGRNVLVAWQTFASDPWLAMHAAMPDHSYEKPGKDEKPGFSRAGRSASIGSLFQRPSASIFRPRLRLASLAAKGCPGGRIG